MQTEMRRVVVMGPAGAGKTSLCWRFGSPDAAFDPSSPRGGDGEPRTVRVDGVDVTMMLQNSYGDVLLNPSGHATKWTNTYLPNSNAVLCVYDASDAASLATLAVWLRENIFDIKCFKVVVANKSDVAPAGSLAGGRALADECCCAFHAISVKDGTNVAALFEAVVRGVWRNNSLPMIRHVILGPSGAGKTSLFRRMYGREFETEVPPTIGVDFAMLTMDSGGCPAKFQTWDTAGFTSGRIGASKLTWRNSYLRGSHAATLVFDASDPASFECVAQWLRANCFKMLVGTKCDLEARVDPADVRALAELCGGELFMTSAKDGANFREMVATGQLVPVQIADGKDAGVSDDD